MGDTDDGVCELRSAIHKLPNSLIDVCLIYGLDEKTSGSLKQQDSPGENLLEKLHELEVEPYSLAVINATLTHFPHLSSGGLDDSYMSIDTALDEKELGVSWDVVRTLQKFFYPEGAVIEVTDEQPPSSTMSLVLTDIVGLRTYCTGLRFYRPFIVVENGDQYRLEPCSRNSYTSGTKLVYVPTCAVLKSVNPHYNIQKELLSSLLYNLAQEDDLMFWDVLKKFVQKLFLIPVPPPGRICIDFSLNSYSGCINPPLSEFVNLDIRLNYPFLSLSVDHVLEVVGAFLLEQRILFTSVSYTLLTYNIECFLHFISPFEWRSTYVPVLPNDKMELLEAPGVFLFGCHSSNLKSDTLGNVGDLVVVDLDKDEVKLVNFQENVPKMPKKVCEDFKKSYKQLRRWYELDEPDNPILLPATLSMQHRRDFERRHDIHLLDLFLNLMVDLFGEIAHHLCSGNIRYEECSIYKLADKDTQEFYKVALTTDLFSLLLHTRKDSATRDSFTRLSEKKRRSERVTVNCNAKEMPVKQKSEEMPTKHHSLINVNRQHSYHPSTSTGHVGQTETFTYGSRKSIARTSLKSSDSPRLLLESDSPSDVTCACDPSMYCKVTLPSLCGEVAPEKFYGSLIDTVSSVIKESSSAAATDKMAPALYLRACLFIAIGQYHKGFQDFVTLDKHSVQLMPSQKMLDDILAPLPEQVAKKLKSENFWSIFSRHSRGYSRQASYRVPDVKTKLPTKPLRSEEFQKVMQKNKIAPDADSANRLYYLLVEKKPAMTPNDFEAFYTSFKSFEDGLNAELPVDFLLKSNVIQFKHSERVLATLTSSELKTSCGSGHVILTTCRLLVRSCLKIHTICELKSDMKVEKQENINVIGQGQPQITFLLPSADNNVGHQRSTLMKRYKQKQQQPHIIFNDKTTRERWLKMIREMQIGLLLAKTKKDVQFIKQAEYNIIIFGTILSSNLRCKTVVQRSPFHVLHLSTKDTSESELKVTVEESLMYRINPSSNEVITATIECSLYVPPGDDSGTGKLWLGLGTGLLRVYDCNQYFLESDTKITDTRQRSGARLSSFLLVDNYVWAASLYRTIYILDSDTSTVVSKLSNLEDDPSVLALGKLDHQQVVWSLLIKGIVIAWNPLTRERVMTIKLPIKVPKNHNMICYTMAILEDHLWIGTNLDKIVVLKVENNSCSLAEEVHMETTKPENQIKCVTISNNKLVWCSTKAPNHLMVFDAETFQKLHMYADLRENKPVNVILPVNDKVWCGTKDGKILIFEDKKDFGGKFQPKKTISAQEDTIRTMLLTENGYVISGSGSKDGSAAVWNPQLIKYVSGSKDGNAPVQNSRNTK